MSDQGLKGGSGTEGAAARVRALAASAAFPATRALLERLADHVEWCETGGRRGAYGVFDGQDMRPLEGMMKGLQLTALSAKKACFAGVDLSAAQLQGADLAEADLRGADLDRADLRGARFDGADLSRAYLRHADLGPLQVVGGRVRRTSLRGASLRNANLEEATLIEARFDAAELAGANLLGADTAGASFEGAGLLKVRGLAA